MNPASEIIQANVAAALAEDLGDGDRTAAVVPAGAVLEVQVISRDNGVLAGTPWFDEVFRQLDPAIAIDWLTVDGRAVSAEEVLCKLAGPARPLLGGERTALNFLQLLSGTATLTRRYLDAIAGTGVVLLDTRKTLPGLRQAQKFAVRCGGAQNHRMGLYDAFLLKENHLAAAGGIAPAVALARGAGSGLPVSVEVETLEELDEAVAAGADRALLDNFSLMDLRRAARRHREAIELEASGNISLDNIRAVAATGVHFISVGELTKRVEPLDLSMRYIQRRIQV